MEKYSPTKEELQEYLAYHSKEDVMANLKKGFEEIETYDWNSIPKGATLFCGGVAAFDKGILDFLNQWHLQEPLFLLSEVTAEFRRYTKDKAKMPYLCTPHLLAKEMIISSMDLDFELKAKMLCDEKVFVKEAMTNLQFRHPNLGNNYAMVWCYYATNYIECLIRNLKPSKVILWNEFYAFHHIIRGICLEKSIPVSYMEFGCIPGTFAYDTLGQQGESQVALLGDEKSKCSKYSIQDKILIKRILRWLKVSELNRNKQPQNKFKISMINNYKKYAPIIVYLGQNDYESGLQPYTDNSQKYHSPYFRTSDEAAKLLENICNENGWNFVYKLHPIMANLGNMYELQKNTRGVVVDKVDINSLIKKADVVITILSQGAYISLIQKKPVVMLGYTQLKNKGCTYQIWDYVKQREDLKVGLNKCVIDALQRKYTIIQKRKFMRHVIYMLNEYLFDDLSERDIRYGKKLL